MKNMVRQPFTPGGKFVASKAFRFAGKAYNAGDEFPWRQLSCSVRRLRSLYEGRYLNNVYLTEAKAYDPDAEDTSPDAEDTSTDEAGGQDTEESSDEEVEVTSELVYDPDVHEIVNPARGEWYMDKDGEHLLRLTADEAKRLRRSRNSVDIDPEAVIED